MNINLSQDLQTIIFVVGLVATAAVALYKVDNHEKRIKAIEDSRIAEVRDLAERIGKAASEHEEYERRLDSIDRINERRTTHNE